MLNELLKSPKVNLQLQVSTQHTVYRVGMTVCDHYLHCQDLEGNTALHMAVVAHRSEAVRVLLEAGAKPTIPNHGYFTPILEAAKNGFYAYVTTSTHTTGYYMCILFISLAFLC